jgi:prepilin-type N-terminal cleavage/methylation domain-containing protein
LWFVGKTLLYCYDNKAEDIYKFFMIKKGKYIWNAFTLIELMVVITISWILVVWVSNVDWNRLSDRQKFTIFQNRIISEIETVRNNALFWKGIWASLDVPETWTIDVSRDWFDISHQSWAISTAYTNSNIWLKQFETIQDLYCWSTQIPPSATPITVIIENADINFTWATVCDDEHLLSVVLEYRWFTGAIELNSINGLVWDKQ